jgi:hypothetical protein
MSRDDYYNYPTTDKPKVFEPQQNKPSDGPVQVTDMSQLKRVTLEYLATCRNGEYYQAFQMVDKLIKHSERVDKVLHDLTKYTTI